MPIPPPPTFRQLTFRRGTIWSARFAPDGDTIVYGAAWDGRPVEPFLTRLGGPESRRHVSGWRFVGTLARVALAGGSPRPVLEDVGAADWSRDGKEICMWPAG